MSHHYFRYLTIMIVILLALLPLMTACGRNNRGTSAPLDGNALATAAAQTLQAQSALPPAQAGGQAQPPAGAALPVIIASVDTNCRTGPSPDNPAVAYLAAGQQSTVLGSEPSGNWWLIANPKDASQTCWVWAETTTVSSDTANLPGVEAGSVPQQPGQEPPPQQPAQLPPAVPVSISATAKFSSIVVCSHASWAIFEVQNTGSLWIKSTNTAFLESASHRDLGVTKVNRPFLQAPQGCPPGVTDLKAGSLGYMAAKLAPSANVNDQVEATITLCSEPDQVGSCTTVLVRFIIPAAMPPPPGPPPEPAGMSAEVNFSNIHDCPDRTIAVFKVVNNGSMDILSIDTLMNNLDTGVTLMHGVGTSFFLPTKDSCPPGGEPLKAGNSAFLYVSFSREKVSTGQKVDTTIKLCSNADMTGSCSTVLVQFTYQ